MTRSIVALSLATIFTSTFVSAETIEGSSYDRSGFGVNIGYAMTSLDNVTAATESGVSFGVSYTFNNGLVIAGSYVPTIVEDSASIGYLGAHVEASQAHLMVGYESMSGWRILGGLAATDTEATVYNAYTSVSDSDSSTGFAVQGGYVFQNGITLDAQISVVDFAGIDATTSNLLVGYKF
ncbi:TPA: outer membrane beta-barrel protein [Vibrio harveyi]